MLVAHRHFQASPDDERGEVQQQQLGAASQAPETRHMQAERFFMSRGSTPTPRTEVKPRSLVDFYVYNSRHLRSIEKVEAITYLAWHPTTTASRFPGGRSASRSSLLAPTEGFVSLLLVTSA